MSKFSVIKKLVFMVLINLGKATNRKTLTLYNSNGGISTRRSLDLRRRFNDAQEALEGIIQNSS